MITRRVFVAMLLTMLCLAEVEAKAARGDSLAKKTEEVKKQYMRPEIPPIWKKKEQFFRQFRQIGKPPLESHAAPEDSLTVKKMQDPLFDIEDKGPRILAKAGAGIVTSTASTAAFIGVIAWARSLSDESKRSDEKNDIGSGVGFLIFSLFSHTFGSSIGVTLVDPHDSPNETLRWAQIGGWSGLGAGVIVSRIPEPLGKIGGLAVMYLSPIVTSIYGSEQSRKPPQARRVSVLLGPVPNGGLSTSITLRF